MRRTLFVFLSLLPFCAPSTAQTVSFAIPSQNGAAVMMSDDTLLYLNRDCTASLEGGGAGKWWNGASFRGVNIEGRVFKIERDIGDLPFCAFPEEGIGQQVATDATSQNAEGPVYCDGESALMVIHYWQNSVTPKLISEMCLNRQAGQLSGLENLTGFEIVRRQGLSERYEILSDGPDADSRTSLEIAPSISTWSFYDESEPEALEISASTSGSSGTKSQAMPSRFFSLRGYLSDNRHAGYSPLVERPFYLWANVYRSSESDLDTNAAKVPPLAFSGVLTFNGENTQLTANGDPTYAVEMGPGTANVTLSRTGDGRLEGSIDLEVTNSRLAGFSPGEWRSLSCSIGGLKGHVLGDAGQLVRAIALGNCSISGADGNSGTAGIEVFLEAWAKE